MRLGGRRRRSGAHDVAVGSEMTLDRATAGDRLVVGPVGDEGARIHAIRFGMTEGAEVTCLTRIPGGPIVLKCGRQEIAVGRKLAQCIYVRRCGSAYADLSSRAQESTGEVA